MTEVNNRVFEVTYDDADNFFLTDIDSSVFTAWTSGGTCYRMEVDPKYVNGYTYDLPVDYLKAIGLSDETQSFEILGTGNNRRLCTTKKDAVLVYISNETTTTNLSNRFISAMAFRLAAELAIPLAKKGTSQKEMLGMYDYIVGKTSRADARAERKDLVDADSWITAGNFTV